MAMLTPRMQRVPTDPDRLAELIADRGDTRHRNHVRALSRLWWRLTHQEGGDKKAKAAWLHACRVLDENDPAAAERARGVMLRILSDERRPGRKYRGGDRSTFKVYTSPAEIAAIDAAAKREGLSRSGWVRRLIDRELDREKASSNHTLRGERTDAHRDPQSRGLGEQVVNP